MTQFSIECSACKKDIEFQASEVDGLEEHIEREVDAGSAQAISEAHTEYEDFVDPSSLLLNDDLKSLSAAIRRGDRSEAELMLDRLVDGFGTDAQEAVQQGRFSLRVLA